ncbi:lytic transglycosylase domain-containing protein [uncultured Microbacterium sp.]|uniref:lytic transglycosylase domain-containing protein n=1 Tax=uncultured Microbacterium sp. TaxID=191216 RepID=UPI0025EEFE01|nr:lytic murein transglycosylase [uncultured Microbacterium sp.]
MQLDDTARRPFWPWAVGLAVVLAVAGGLMATAQAAAHEAERTAADRSAAARAGSWEVPTVAAAGDVVAASDQSPVTDATPAPASGAVAPADVVAADPTWTSTIAGRTGIPDRALRAYATAALTVQREQPGCGIGWNTLAGLGAIESAHGTHSGGSLRADGYPDPPIRGIALDGSASAAIADTDAGVFDGDAVWDRAVGPLQFIPATWQRWGADANGDGAADPNQIDDAALGAARYLCAAGEMTSPAGWRRAVFSYNHLDSYVDDVAATANAYAARAAG